MPENLSFQRIYRKLIKRKIYIYIYASIYLQGEEVSICIAIFKILQQVHDSRLSFSLMFIYIFYCLLHNVFATFCQSKSTHTINRDMHGCLTLPALLIFMLLPTKQHDYATSDYVELCFLLLQSSRLWYSNLGLPLWVRSRQFHYL